MIDHAAAAPAASPPDSTRHLERLSGAFSILLPELRRAIVAAGYQQPTPIQEQGIPPILKGRDVLGSAQTGTGKTAAFTLPMLHRLMQERRRPTKRAPRALILAPTRELAAQIGESIRTYGGNLPLRHTVIFGGVGQGPQVKALNQGVDIVVATPGRLLDLAQQKQIRIDQVEFFVLDEVDRMLDMGFIPDVNRVVARLPQQRQTLFFSATMSPQMLTLAQGMVRDAARVDIAPDKPAVTRIEQRLLFVGKRNKEALLQSLLDDPAITKAVVFTQMKHVADKVVRRLSRAGLNGVAIHGNKSQSARTKALDGFKRGQFRVLVATGVAARGLDVDDITHVINYDLPNDAATYVHRIGRTARAGSSGDAISFCSNEERSQLRDIEKLLGKSVPMDLEHAFHCEDTFRAVELRTKQTAKNNAGSSKRKSQRGPRRFGNLKRNRNRRRA